MDGVYICKILLAPFRLTLGLAVVLPSIQGRAASRIGNPWNLRAPTMFLRTVVLKEVVRGLCGVRGEEDTINGDIYLGNLPIPGCYRGRGE